MPTAADIAAAYGLATADTLPPRPKPVEAHTETRQRWSEEKRIAFRVLDPAALCLVATDGPVSVTLFGRDGAVASRIGHNRGVWPAKLAKTASWKDTVSSTFDKNPFFFLGTQCRWWCRGGPDRDRLSAAVVDLLADYADERGGLTEPLRHGFHDLGADLDLAMFELAVSDMAERINVRIWDDAALSTLLDRTVRRASALREQGRGLRKFEAALEAAAVKEMGL
jgi:hypothetical protein